MGSYLFCQLGDFFSQFRVSLFKHIADPAEMVFVLYQHGIMSNLVAGQSFNDISVKSGPAAIFRKGDPGPFGPVLQQLLFIKRAAEFDVGAFHFTFKLCDLREQSKIVFVVTKTHLAFSLKRRK